MLPLSGPIGSNAALVPRVALSASLHAMANADGQANELELAEVERMLGGGTSVDEGASFLRQRGVDGLLAGLNAALNPAQKRCLLANLLGVAMVDGLLRSAEETLNDRFKSALALSDAEFLGIHGVLLAKCNLAVFGEEAGADSIRIEPVPLTIFCAAILALVEADGAAADEEQEARRRLIEDPATWKAAETLWTERGLEGVLVCLDRLNRAQQRCLLANLVAVGMCDGWLRTAEQELLDRFRQAMAFSPEEYDALYQVLLSKEDLSVFP
jgi:uncharacterized tellurite resistance protein B-like protein